MRRSCVQKYPQRSLLNIYSLGNLSSSAVLELNMADPEAGNTTCSSDQLLCQDNLNFPPTLYCLIVTDNYTCAAYQGCFQCPQLKANPDIAGIGASAPNPTIHIKLSRLKVIASFIISAGLTLVFSIAYLLSSTIGSGYFAPYSPPLFSAAIVLCFSCNGISSSASPMALLLAFCHPFYVYIEALVLY